MIKTTPKTFVTQPVYKQPGLILSAVLWLATLWAKLHYRVSYDRESLKAIRAIKGPVLVIASHHCPLDFAFLTYALFPRRLSIMTAANIYYTKFGKFVRAMKSCIPKKQFTTDFSSVKSARKMLDAGVSVLIYPEARYSLDGRNGKISESLYKLIKWLRVPVISAKCNMAYQTRPRYIDDFRRGRVKVDIKETLTPEDCANLSVDEIKVRLTPWLTFNDMEYQQANNVCFRGKKGYAEGLPDLLYKCPRCGAEFRHKAQGDIMECTACGNMVGIDGYNVITPASKDSVCHTRIDYWYG